MNLGTDSGVVSGADVDFGADSDVASGNGFDGALDTDTGVDIGAGTDADSAPGTDADLESGSGAESGPDMDSAPGTDAGFNMPSGVVPSTGSNVWRDEGDTLAQALECRLKLETYGIYLDDFHVADRDGDGGYGLSAVCGFRIGGDAKPGIYYGRAVSSYKLEGKEWSSTQGFAIEVIAEDPEVAEVIRLIRDLPDAEEIEAALGGFEAAGDEAGYDAYYAGVYEQVMYVWQKYQALTEEQKELVYNRDKLLAFEWLWGIMPLAGQITTWAELKAEIEMGGQKEIRLDTAIPADSSSGVTLPVRVPKGADIVLNLNGKTIEYKGSDTIQANLKNLFEVEEGAVFTIKCSSAAAIDDKGLITYYSRSRMRQGTSDQDADAIEKRTGFDHDKKIVTYYVIQSMNSDMKFVSDPNAAANNASAEKYQIALGSVGAVEASFVDNAVLVRKGGVLNIEGGRITAAKSNRGVFADGGTINISGGYIVGNDSRPAGNVPANGGGVSVTSGGHLNMTGGVIANNKVEGLTASAVTYAMGNGGGVSVQSGGSAVIGGEAVIAGNIAGHGNGGGIYGARGSSVIVEGNAQVVGNIAQAELDSGKLSKTDNERAENFEYFTSEKSNYKGSGGGIYMAPYADGEAGNSLTVKGGRIAGNIADACVKPTLPYSVGGGGIFTGGSLTVEGGSIENNYALEGGGGILIWYKNNGGGHADSQSGYHCPAFYMSGGTVSGNTCDGSEGGGIRCEGIGTIEGGTIEGNITNSGYDYGGGGIYVEMYTEHIGRGGKLTVKNALITGNTAYGYGGGVAGCGKSSIDVLTIKGAAVFDNFVDSYTVDGKPNPKVCAQGAAGDQDVTKDKFPLFFEKKDGQPRNKLALDYFCVGKSVVYNSMLGGGVHSWTGSVCNEEADPSKKNPLTIPPEYADRKGVIGLTAQPSSSDTTLARDAKSVIITGNQSKFHGGGIACNGVLSLGKGSGNLRIEKKLEGKDSQEEFTFKIDLIKDGAPLEGEYPYSGASEGWVQHESRVKLKAGEWIEITGLPHDTVYTVTEEDSSGYDVTMTKNGGSPVSGRSISGTITITNSDSINVESVVVLNRNQDEPDETPPSTDPTKPTNPTKPTDPTKPTRPENPGPTRPRPTEPTRPTGPDRTPSVPPETEETGTTGESNTESTPESSTETESTEPTDSTEPSEPTQPVSEEPDIPELPELPDPNDPDSPDRVIIVEEGVPKTYVKMWDPEQQMFVYIPEEDVPLFGLPKMGVRGRDALCRVMWLAILGIVAEWLFQIVRKRRSRSGHNGHE